ncbi:ATP-binding protein [Nocardioides soli]|uniref:Novel STAND NTPase 1 domain-containing protein n=1 Tax=Nocardioides soli TaxID=1036020 RepID=A0A7W4VZ70_9ACTN|nr:ATP-binding protein [Nocardioides soli]MBB3044486.1 hypothetical protein [Nocardioides soli]
MVQLRPTFASSKPSTNPYVGPRAFGHGDKLYGRDRELLELSDLLVAERIVVLHSPSGAGKTSLIQAEDGLLRVLKRQRFSPLPPVRVNLQPLGKPAVAGRYAYSIMESLESARGTKRQMTSEQLAGMSLARYLKDAYQTSGDGGTSEPLVLILDQFEEVFTLDPTDVDGRIQFFSDLGDLLDAQPIWTLFVMREDLLGELETVSYLVPGELAVRYRLGLLERPAAREAIMKPTERLYGVTFTAEAADRILDNLCTILVQSPGSPPQPQPSPYVEGVILQTVLLKLWRKLDPVREGRKVIELEDLGDLLQHVDRALASHYHDCVEEAVRRSRIPERIIRDWFEAHLITEQGWRNQADRGPGDGGKRTERCLATLEARHIIRSETRLHRQWWELVHDRFLNPVRDDNRRWRRRQDLEIIPTEARSWADDKRPELLLPPERIVAGAAWLTAHEHDAYPHEREFIAASETAAQEKVQPQDANQQWDLAAEYLRLYQLEFSAEYLRTRRVTRRLYVLTGLLAVVVVVLVVLLIWQLR